MPNAQRFAAQEAIITPVQSIPEAEQMRHDIEVLSLDVTNLHPKFIIVLHQRLEMKLCGEGTNNVGHSTQKYKDAASNLLICKTGKVPQGHRRISTPK